VRAPRVTRPRRGSRTLPAAARQREPARHDHRRDHQAVGDRDRGDHGVDRRRDTADRVFRKQLKRGVEARAPRHEHEHARHDEDERRAPHVPAEHAARDPNDEGRAEDARLLAEQRSSGEIREQREHRSRAHDRRIPGSCLQPDGEREPRCERRDQHDAHRPGMRHDALRPGERRGCDGATDLDAEYEAEQLHDRFRGVCDTGLELLGRELAYADRERHSRQERDECSGRDDVGRRAETETGGDGCAEARDSAGERSDRGLGARRPHDGKRHARDGEADERSRGRLPPASAEHRRDRGSRKRIRGDDHGQRTPFGVAVCLLEPCERLLRIERRIDDVADDRVEPRDRTEIDAGREHAQRVRPLLDERSEGKLDDRRRCRYLHVAQPDRVREHDYALLELGRRVAGIVSCPREAEQKLDGSR